MNPAKSFKNWISFKSNTTENSESRQILQWESESLVKTYSMIKPKTQKQSN